MEPRTLDTRIMQIVGKWSYEKKASFKHWHYHELVNESWIAAKKILHRYDPDRGNLTTFLWAHLFCPVSTAYYKAFAISVTRTGSGGKRSYVTRWRELPDGYDGQEAVIDQDETARLNIADPDGMLMMLRRGMNQAQVAYALNLSPSRISQRLKEIRESIS